MLLNGWRSRQRIRRRFVDPDLHAAGSILVYPRASGYLLIRSDFEAEERTTYKMHRVCRYCHSWEGRSVPLQVASGRW